MSGAVGGGEEMEEEEEDPFFDVLRLFLDAFDGSELRRFLDD